jgi:hypothetical protein
MNLLTSLPFDRKNEVAKAYLDKSIFSSVFCIVDSVKKNKNNQKHIFEFPKFDNLEIYLDHVVKLHSANYGIDYFKFKYNMIHVLNRWIRTYDLGGDLVSLDHLSNKIYNYWYEFLIDNNIKKVILGNVPHTPHDYTIYYICKLLRINIIIFQPFNNPFSEIKRYLLMSDFDWGNRFLNEITNDDSLPEDLEKIFSLYDESKQLSISKQIIIQEKSNFLKKLLTINLIKANRILSKILFRFTLLYKIIVERTYLFRLSNLTSEKIDEDNYVFFPLHFQPEATTIPVGNQFLDQLEIIRILSLNLPVGCTLLVKEHPAYWTRKILGHLSEYIPIKDVRPFRFYKELLKISNVRLVNHNLDSHKLLHDSKGVVTVSGTIALEAALNGRPVLMFGDHYYNQLINVTKFKNLDDIKVFNRQILHQSKTNFSSTDLYRFLNLVKLNSIIINYNCIYDDFVYLLEDKKKFRNILSFLKEV